MLLVLIAPRMTIVLFRVQRLMSKLNGLIGLECIAMQIAKDRRQIIVTGAGGVSELGGPLTSLCYLFEINTECFYFLLYSE